MGASVRAQAAAAGWLNRADFVEEVDCRKDFAGVGSDRLLRLKP